MKVALPAWLVLVVACSKTAPATHEDAGAVAASAAPPAPSSAPADEARQKHESTAVVREETTVVVAGKTEHWRLEWRKPPTPECMDDSVSTCPCEGIEFGEEGELDLVRERDGQPEDRLHLSALYTEGTARLPRWKRLPADEKAVPSPAQLRTRPLVPVLKLADYDHDGQATELVLRVGYDACGHWPSLVVGVDAKNPLLHAFGAVETKGDPLLLESPHQWEQVRAALPIVLERIGCGDHGSEQSRTTRVSRDDAGLHATDTEKRCP